MKRFFRFAPLAAVILSAGTAQALTRNLEWLDRGLVAINTSGSNVFLSWRVLGTDAATSFNLYRDGVLIATIAADAASNYVDASGSLSARYSVRAVVGGVEQAADSVTAVRAKPWISIPLSRPAGGTLDDSAYTYSPNDASTGDLDGDGKLDLVLKWDPSNSKDNSQSGHTGNVFLDAYTLEGTRLWRIDLGVNIRAGAHYTQFLVADFDGDGKAEVMCKTAPGTRSGTGELLSLGPAASDTDANDYRNSNGYILSGPEYLTVFRGSDGAEIATANYSPARGTVKNWGDSYGNRVDRFLATTAWLGNGANPSAVFQRGYYTRMAVAAWDWDGSTLAQRWGHNSATSGSGCYGQGNHNLSAADVDGDGYDEIVEGACALDHDGSLMYRTGLGHGDAMHLGDLDPDHAGLEVWEVHEETDAAYGYEMHDAATGEILWGVATGTDNGRGLAADIDSTSRGYEAWSFGASGILSATGTTLSTSRPTINFRVYWDGDLYDEVLDGTKLDKWTGSGTTRLATFYNYPSTANGTVSNNSTKSNPSLVADLLGDWREEVVLPTANADSLVVFTTTTTTTHRLYTLMHDPVYRNGVAWQNSGYNQPPHLGFWLGAGTASAPIPDIALVGAPAGIVNTAPVFSGAKSFTISENTTAVGTLLATDAEGDTVTYAISGGDDSALFTVDSATGALAFRGAPDFEEPVDEGLDNIYKVIVSASDGKIAKTVSIAVLVTDVSEGTTAVAPSGRATVAARVVWLDLRGAVLGIEPQRLDPASPRPVAPAGLRGVRLARVTLPDGAAVTLPVLEVRR